ncbi:MAG: SPFH/Band 7/PHB domain protein [Holosporales bacterium]|jgi:regulator of protease activity HflC (stomatin/prohibitin superfamily)|nr:SPFH/Band 7/PHB domain protein [Holosporales bacterium]
MVLFFSPYIAAGGVLLILLLMCVVIVPQGYEYTLERFGRYIRTLQPGIHFIMPIVERIGAKVSLMETVLDVPSQDVITKDNAAVTVDGVVFFKVVEASKSAYKVANLQQAMLNLTMTNIRTVMGSMDLDELLSNREAINARLLVIVNGAAGHWGTQVTRIEIKDIRPPRDLVDSMARQMKAERDKRAAILEAEGEKQAQILRSEGAKRSMVLQAEGRLESAAKDAEARERLAKAEAVATKLLSEATRDGDAKALNYFVAQKYVEAITVLAQAPNQKVLLMPLDVANLAGTVTGITEIVKQTFSKGSGKQAPEKSVF